jgi:hypothetical protein
MTSRRGKQSQNRRRRTQEGRPRPSDLWRPVPEPAPPEPIAPTPDPTTLLRSLGTPPLPGHGATAEHYLAAVVERAAGVAVALAASAGLLADTEPDG